MDYEELLKNHLDSQNRLLRWPTKYKTRILALFFLARFFDRGRIYTQNEVDAILLDHHFFNDCCTLRRELINTRFLERTPDGKSYWVPEKVPALENFGIFDSLPLKGEGS
jgi:hypothetical protein